MNKILIVEDDPAILIGLEAALEEENFDIITASDGVIGYNIALKKNPDLVILDIMLPSRNGLEVCKSLRDNGYDAPILMLTSKKEEPDRISGFKCGADDYVTKPFSIQELVMRIRALLRRASVKEKKPDVFAFGNIRVEFKKLDAFKNGEPLGLSAKEFQILKYFIDREGEVISRNQLLDDIWGYDSFPTTRTVDNYILSLRKKIEDEPSNPRHIITIHTVGYKFLK